MGDRLRVLSICTSDHVGGAAKAAYRIQLAVRELGIDSQMLVKDKGTLDPNVVSLDEFIPKNRSYRLFDWIRNKIKNKIQHFRWRRYPRRLSYYLSDMRSTDICGVLQKLDYDILHLHWINQRFLPLDKLPKDKPIVWTLHDSWPFCGVCHYFLNCKGYQKECGHCPMLGSDLENDLSHQIWHKKKVLYQDLALHIVTPSRWLAECAKKSSLLGRFPISVIPNCLDVNLFRPLQENEISPRWRYLQEKKSEKPYLLYGAMNATTDKIKGFSNLLSALQILDKQGKGNLFELIVFGTDQPLEGIPTTIPIHYVGYVQEEQEIVSLYNLAAVMVVPSLTENLSNTIMESLSCGTPVVAFDIGGNGDMIAHKKNGYLAKEQDNLDLAEGVLWCLESNAGKAFSVATRQSVIQRYAPLLVGRHYLDLYSSI